MDRKNLVHSTEEVFIQNPLNMKESQQKLKKRLKMMDFDVNGSMYPAKVMNNLKRDIEMGVDTRPPKLIFLPDDNLIQVMIKANLRFSRRDQLFQFLLRFGLLEGENFWSKSEDFLESINYL